MARIAESDTVHTFKNHLHLTLSYCALLLDELPADSPVRADVQEIQKAVRHAIDMLPQLLASATHQDDAPVPPAPKRRS